MAANNTLPEGHSKGTQMKKKWEKKSIERINKSSVISKLAGLRTCEAVMQAVCVKRAQTLMEANDRKGWCAGTLLIIRGTLLSPVTCLSPQALLQLPVFP